MPLAPDALATADPTKHLVFHNPRLEDLHAPVAGPAHPYRADGLAAGQRNHPTGFVEVSARVPRLPGGHR